MILLELFWGFFQVGLFSFGGGYAAIPLIRDTVLAHGWLSDDMLSYMIGVSESTPGPIMVNLATYVGRETAGLTGAAAATFAVVLPPFFILLLIAAVLKNVMQKQLPQAVLTGLKAGAVGVILATGAWMIYKNGLPGGAFEWKAAAVTLLLAAVLFVPQFTIKKKLSPILLILIAAALGVLFYGVA